MITLLELKAIQRGLENRFSQPKFNVPGLRLMRSNLDDLQVTELEQSLDVKLPENFRKLILTYNFCDLALGGVFFGAGGDYAKAVRKLNVELEYPWWGRFENRPTAFLLIASTDGHLILLDV